MRDASSQFSRLNGASWAEFTFTGRAEQRLETYELDDMAVLADLASGYGMPVPFRAVGQMGWYDAWPFEAGLTNSRMC